MTELELRQMFKNLSDCYADTGRTEGLVIQAMTEDRFIEALKEAKLLPIPDVVGRSEQLICNICKSGLIDYPEIYRRTCCCGGLGYNVTD